MEYQIQNKRKCPSWMLQGISSWFDFDKSCMHYLNCDKFMDGFESNNVPWLSSTHWFVTNKDFDLNISWPKPIYQWAVVFLLLYILCEKCQTRTNSITKLTTMSTVRCDTSFLLTLLNWKIDYSTICYVKIKKEKGIDICKVEKYLCYTHLLSHPLFLVNRLKKNILSL